MQTPDILQAIQPVISAFDKLSIPYYISGSIASSMYGIGVIKVQRKNLDVEYLRKWGEYLGLFDLLTKAFHEAGLEL